MTQREWIRTLASASGVGDRIPVGDVREALGDLPDDADLVVAVRDGSGSAAAVGSVLVERVAPAGRDWNDHARLEVGVSFPAAGGVPCAARPRAAADGSRRV